MAIVIGEVEVLPEPAAAEPAAGAGSDAAAPPPPLDGPGLDALATALAEQRLRLWSH